jgi:hypothetical protein
VVASRHRRRWDLWIVDRWLSFQLRLPGASQGRVPPPVACRPCGLPSEACMPQPSTPASGSGRACGGPGFGKSAWACWIASRAAPGTLGRSPRARVFIHSWLVHLLPSPRGKGSGAPLGSRSPRPGRLARGSYLVDSASSHMLVSKIKPCMSKYKHFVL